MLSQMSSFQFFFSCLNNIPLHTWNKKHIFFTYSYFDGPLSCFLVKGVAVNMWVHISFHISVFFFLFSSDKYLSEIAESYSSFIFHCLRSFHTFSLVAIPIYILTSSAQRFLVLHILTDTCYFLMFW